MAGAYSSSSGRSRGAHDGDGFERDGAQDGRASSTTKYGRSRVRGRDGEAGSGAATPGKSVDRTSPAELDKAALRYLNRYDASVEQLRRVLFRHVERHASGAALSRARDDVRALLERYQASRILDDARYAEALGRGLRARGASTMSIRMKLRARGVAEDLTEAALERLASHADDGNPELSAARAYVRRKRLTKRHDVSTPEGRNKALGSLGRQGFSYSVASAALAAELSAADEPREW
jgi:regulatory protein